MATDTRHLGDSLDMGTADLLGRHTLEISVIRSLSERSDLRGFLRFSAHFTAMALTGTVVWLSREHWYLLVPAMVVHGFTIVTMFAPMHECIHKTAFKTRRLNEIFGGIAGVIAFYNATYYRRYHTWHHRYTQDTKRDPELSTPPPRTRLQYALQVSGLPFWYRRPQDLVKMAFGRLHKYPFIPADARALVTISAAAQVAIYAAVVVASIVTRNPAALYLWFLPAFLAQPLLRAILIAEHTGCSVDENGLTNTRTTLTIWPIRLLMWNMPYHAEHHLYPSIPFHQLPRAHREIREKLTHIAPGYVAANRTVIQSFDTAPRSE